MAETHLLRLQAPPDLRFATFKHDSSPSGKRKSFSLSARSGLVKNATEFNVKTNCKLRPVLKIHHYFISLAKRHQTPNLLSNQGEAESEHLHTAGTDTRANPGRTLRATDGGPE